MWFLRLERCHHRFLPQLGNMYNFLGTHSRKRPGLDNFLCVASRSHLALHRSFAGWSRGVWVVPRISFRRIQIWSLKSVTNNLLWFPLGIWGLRLLNELKVVIRLLENVSLSLIVKIELHNLFLLVRVDGAARPRRRPWASRCVVNCSFDQLRLCNWNLVPQLRILLRWLCFVPPPRLSRLDAVLRLDRAILDLTFDRGNTFCDGFEVQILLLFPIFFVTILQLLDNLKFRYFVNFPLFFDQVCEHFVLHHISLVRVGWFLLGGLRFLSPLKPNFFYYLLFYFSDAISRLPHLDRPNRDQRWRILVHLASLISRPIPWTALKPNFMRTWDV